VHPERRVWTQTNMARRSRSPARGEWRVVEAQCDGQSMPPQPTPADEQLYGSGKGVKPMRIPMWSAHPGGQSSLRVARACDRPDLMFLSYHLGFDWSHITKSCAARGVEPPERGPLYDALSEAMRSVYLRHGERERRIYEAWCLLTTLLIVPTYVAHVTSPAIWNTLGLSFLFMTYFLNIFHMRHHRGKTFNNRTLTALTSPLYDTLDNTFGIHIESWLLSHNARHHVHTNHEDHDPDVKITANLMRLHPVRPVKWFNKWQSVYCPALFSLAVGMYPWLNAFVKTPRGQRGYLMVWMALCVAVPYSQHGLVGLAWIAGMYALTSTAIAYLFTVSHNNDGIEYAHDTPARIDEWITHQVVSAVSWGGYASTLVCGGLNLQIEHHLAPAHVPTLYHHFRPELQRILAEHKVAYKFHPSLLDAAIGMHSRLHQLGGGMLHITSVYM